MSLYYNILCNHRLSQRYMCKLEPQLGANDENAWAQTVSIFTYCRSDYTHNHPLVPLPCRNPVHTADTCRNSHTASHMPVLCKILCWSAFRWVRFNLMATILFLGLLGRNKFLYSALARVFSSFSFRRHGVLRSHFCILRTQTLDVKLSFTQAYTRGPPWTFIDIATCQSQWLASLKHAPLRVRFQKGLYHSKYWVLIRFHEQWTQHKIDRHPSQ
jgi:hypothetical protein